MMRFLCVAAVVGSLLVMMGCGTGAGPASSNLAPVQVLVTKPAVASATVTLEVPPMWGEALIEGTARPEGGTAVTRVRYAVTSATGAPVPDGTGDGIVVATGGGSVLWRLPSMALRPGVNTITVTVFDARGRSGQASVTIKMPAVYIAVDTANNAIYQATRLADIPSTFTGPACFILARVPAGTYTLGSTAATTIGYDPTQDATRTSVLPAYYVSLTEITALQWAHMTGDSAGIAANDRRSVTDVARDDITATLITAGARVGLDLRLPTNDEWEVACRATATTGSPYSIPTSADPATYARTYSYGLPEGQTAPALLLPNPWGFYDMHGNVAEITQEGAKDASWTENWVFQRASSNFVLPDTAIHPTIGFRPALTEVP